MEVSIIIVNYNTKELLKECIKSIHEKTIDVIYEVIVVDNASTDGSKGMVKELYKEVILIESNKNLGFGKANNLGATIAKGEFLFFLNSDTVLFENSIKHLEDFFRSNESKLRIGALGTLLVNKNFVTNGFGGNFTNCKIEIKNNLKRVPLLSTFVIPIKNTEYPEDNEYFKIDYVIGADLFIRKLLFEKLEGFSIEFFMYYEELDLQNRMDKLGFRSFITTKTKIIHLEDGTGKNIKNYSNRKRTIVHKSKNIYLKRNDARNFSKYVSLDFILLILNFLNFKYSFRENLNYFREIIKTY